MLVREQGRWTSQLPLPQGRHGCPPNMVLCLPKCRDYTIPYGRAGSGPSLPATIRRSHFRVRVCWLAPYVACIVTQQGRLLFPFHRGVSSGSTRPRVSAEDSVIWETLLQHFCPCAFREDAAVSGTLVPGTNIPQTLGREEGVSSLEWTPR